MKRLFYLAFWFFKARFLGRRNPLQTVLFISDLCNLSCRHCNIYAKTEPLVKSFQQIRQELEYAYGLGSRFVDLEGGEPLLWRDGERGLNEVIDLAREIGFYSVTVTTNAQQPFQDCRADSIWVSLDGLDDAHDLIRGPGAFQKLLRNAEQCGHRRLSANMVVNSLNYKAVRPTIEFVKSSPHFKSISINFHTPYPGTEELFLDWESRGRVIDEVIEMKKSGYPVMNSVSGLKLMKGADFTKHCWVTNFIMVNGDRLPQCQGQRAEVCDRCGFCMAGEMYSVFSFKPDTIFAGMSLRVSSK